MWLAVKCHNLQGIPFADPALPPEIESACDNRVIFPILVEINIQFEESIMSVTGQCLCGQVKYKIANAPSVAGVCHCKNCQRQAGSAFSTIAGVPRADFSFTSGEPKLYRDGDTKSGNTVDRYFCGNCGSPIYSALQGTPDTFYLKTGTMDDTSGFQPQFHVWCDTKQNWVELAEGVPQMATQS